MAQHGPALGTNRDAGLCCKSKTPSSLGSSPLSGSQGEVGMLGPMIVACWGILLLPFGSLCAEVPSLR